MNVKNVGEGKVCLLAGGDKIYTDIAARFVRSERGLKDIIASDYDASIVENILKGGHLAATEFDYFIFGVEGYARVTEVQLVRKRLASYLIKSGRVDKGGKRSFDVVTPKSIDNHSCRITIPASRVKLWDGVTPLLEKNDDPSRMVYIDVTTHDLLSAIETWYNTGVEAGIPEEDLRYMKPQATEFKAIIGMNAHALIDWFKIRCCCNAQAEIRDMARKMLSLCKEAAPDLFANAGPNCVSLGYCPENQYQNKACVGMVITKNQAMPLLKTYFDTIKEGSSVVDKMFDVKPLWK